MNTRDIAAEYRLSHWAQIVQDRSQKGLSIRAYCAETGIHENIYIYWRRKCTSVGLNVPVYKSATGQAKHYLMSQRKYLERCLLDGRLEISYNRAERSIKPFVIDHKNFLFANTPSGAKASAVMFSLIETTKEYELNPFMYLVYVFENAPNRDIRNGPNALERLLPASAPSYIRATKCPCPPV